MAQLTSKISKGKPKQKRQAHRKRGPMKRLLGKLHKKTNFDPMNILGKPSIEKSNGAPDDTIVIGTGTATIANRQVSKKHLIVFAAVFAVIGAIIILRSFADTPTTANLWVDPNGGTCSRQATATAYSDGAACGNLQAAWSAASAGDTIVVKAGTYTANQNITGDKISETKVVGENGVLLSGGLDTNASYLTIENVTTKGMSMQGNGVHDITLKNVNVDGAEIYWHAVKAYNIKWIGGSLKNYYNTPGYPAAFSVYGDTINQGSDNFLRDVIIDGVTFSNISWNTSNAAEHFEVIRVDGNVQNLTIRNSTFTNTNANTGTLFFTSFTGSQQNGLMLENNFFDAPGDAYFVINNNICNNWNLRYNTFKGSAMAAGNCSPSNVAWTGNLSPVGVCMGNSFTNNVWYGSGSGCGASDKVVASPGFDTDGFHLLSSSLAKDAAGTGANCIATDHDGGARPVGSACDAGAHEYGSTSSSSSVANIWVDLNGGSCLRQAAPGAYNDSQACGSFTAAYNAAQANDIIMVTPGTYPKQDVPTGQKAVTFRGQTGAILRQLDVAAANTTFDGLDLDAGNVKTVNAVYEPHAANITFKNGKIGNVVDEKGSLAGADCANCTYDNVEFHDVKIATDGVHNECLYSQAPDITVKNSKFTNCATMDIFFTRGTWWNQPTYGGFTLTNNFFGKTYKLDGTPHYFTVVWANNSPIDRAVVRNNTFELPVSADATFTNSVESCNTPSSYLDLSGMSHETCSTDPTPTAPTVSISANPTTLTEGNASTLTWSSTNATSCTASGAWSGTKATSGSQSTGTLSTTGTNTYTLSCSGSSGSASASATVDVTAAPAPSSQTPVAAYGFEEGSGTTATDSSGNNNTLTMPSTAWTTVGKNGKAASFNGSATSFGQRADSTSLDLAGTGTIEAWFKPNSLGIWHGIVAKGSANDSNVHNYSLEVDNNNKAVCSIGNGSANTTTTGSTSLVAGTFYHLACVWDGTNLKLYVNGAQNASAGQSITPAGNTASLYIGQYGGNADQANGIIDDVRIYNKALSASEVVGDMNTAVTSGPPDTQAPTAPTTFTAVNTSPAPQVKLDWSGATDNVKVTNYLIYRYVTSAGQNGAAVIANLGEVTTYTDTTASYNTNYSYYVIVKDAAGNLSSASATKQVTTPAAPPDSTAPPTPVLSGTSGDKQANLSWPAVSDPSGIKEYRIYKDGSSTAYATLTIASSNPCNTASPSICTWGEAGLVNGTAYSYTVQAVDGANLAGTKSNSVSLTPQGSATQTNCAVKPSNCGYPDVGTVGTISGVTRTNETGTINLYSGQTYENKTLTGDIWVHGPNVTIRNVKLISDSYYPIRTFSDEGSTGNLLIDHVEIDLKGKFELKAVAFDNYKLTNSYIHNGGECAHFGENVTIENNLCVVGPDANSDGVVDATPTCSQIEDQYRTASGDTAHFDGFQTDGSSNIKINHNTVYQRCPQTSNILLNGATATNIVVNDNLLSGGGYTIYCPGPNNSGVVISNNRISRLYYPNGGFYGPTAYCENIPQANLFGNVWDDTGASLDGSSTPPTDTTPPTISITTPTNNATVSGTITTTATASDNVGVAKVEFYVDNETTPRITDSVSPYNYSIDTLTLTNGSHTIKAKAYDAANNTTSTTITINVNNPDTIAPSVPQNTTQTGSTATSISLAWSPSTDNVGVAGYRLFKAGAAVATTTSTTYTYSGLLCGTTYTVGITAYDAAGNESNLAENTGQMTTAACPGDTTAPTAFTLSPGAITSTQVNLSWTKSTDPETGIKEYRVFRNGTQVGTVLPGICGTTCTYGESAGITPGTTYSYYVQAVNNATPTNLTTDSNTISVTTPPASQTQTLAFAPTADAWVNQQFPGRTYGTTGSLKGDSSPNQDILMNFTVSGIGTKTVKSAKIRLYVTNGSDRGGDIYKLLSTSWNEANVTWNTAPAQDSSVIASLGTTAKDSYAEFDLTGKIVADGVYGFKISLTSSNNVIYNSKEAAANKPQLVLTVE